MEADPEQCHDIAGQKPQIARRLAKAVEQWKKEVLSQAATEKRYFPVGYDEFPTTILPARDGTGKGNIKRSAPAPNCSYFTNWVGAEDEIRWDIEVVTYGTYQAVIYYTCAKKNTGSTIELVFQGSGVRGKVTEPHDPPARGAEFDRVKRESASYVKDFRPLRLGTMRLKKGRGQLILRAVKVAGAQVMEVSAVVLVKLQTAVYTQRV